MPAFSVFYLHLLSSDLSGGKAVQSLVRHITLAEVLALLRLEIKLVWLKCHPPFTMLPSPVIAGSRAGMAQQLLTCYHLQPNMVQ